MTNGSTPSETSQPQEEFFSHSDEGIANHKQDGNTTASIATNGDGLQPTVSVQQELTMTGYFMMCGFLFVLALCLFLLVWNNLRNRRRRFRLSLQGGGVASTSTNRSIKQRIQRRYETVEHWIISKTVLEHTDFCSAVVADFDHHNHPHHADVTAIVPGETAEAADHSMEPRTVIKSTLPALVDTKADSEHLPTEPCCSLEDDDSSTELQECPICMLELLPGEIVSWSANEQCCHVYHHECIKEWLLRNTMCCMCKAIYLPVDGKQGKTKTTALNELSLQFAAAAATSYYCATSGLVRIPKTVRCTRQELNQLERRIFDGAVPPAKLIALRGSRTEGTAQSCKSSRDTLFTTPASDNETVLPYVARRADSVQSDDLTGSMDLNSSSFDNFSSSDVNVSHGGDATSEDAPALDAIYHDMEVGSSSLMSLMERTSRSILNVSVCNELQLTCSTSQSGHQRQELISATDYLEQNSHASYPDSRWCIQTSDNDDLEGGGVEIQETTSATIIVDVNQS